jgi:hypothetical protein
MKPTMSRQATGETDEPPAAPAGDAAASRWQPAVAFAALLLLAFAYHAGYLAASGWLSDEVIFPVAVRMVLDGRSPYDQAVYLGTPTFAYACAWAARRIGLFQVALVVRALNVVATAVVAWMASRWVRSTLRIRCATAVLVLLAAPPLLDALRAGNPSPIVNALTLIVLVSWRRHPVAAGLALGVGLVIKPYALLLIPVLFAARLERPTRAHVIAPLTAGAVFLSALLAIPSEFWRMLAQHEGFNVEGRSMSLQRPLYCLIGWGPSTTTILIVVTLAAVIHVRLRQRSDGEVAHVAMLACILGLTRIWLHTLTLALPLVCQVLAERTRRLAAAWQGPVAIRKRLLMDLIGSVALVFILFNCDTWVCMTILYPALPRWADALFALLPLAALLALFWQGLRYEEAKRMAV